MPFIHTQTHRQAHTYILTYPLCASLLSGIMFALGLDPLSTYAHTRAHTHTSESWDLSVSSDIRRAVVSVRDSASSCSSTASRAEHPARVSVRRVSFCIHRCLLAWYMWGDSKRKRRGKGGWGKGGLSWALTLMRSTFNALQSCIYTHSLTHTHALTSTRTRTHTHTPRAP